MPPEHNPLIEPPPKEIPLSEAPLVQVIAQVRYPLQLSLNKQESIVPVQEALRSEFPILQQEQSSGLILSKTGIEEGKAETIWRFSDLSGFWRASLSPSFVALETRKYTSRDDFIRRLEGLLHCVFTHVTPPRADRIGVRYIDRVVVEDPSDLNGLLRPEAAGVLSTNLGPFARMAMGDAVFEVPDDQGLIHARWGLLPPNATSDPATIVPSERASWILDLDMYKQAPTAFDVDMLSMTARSFAERIYGVFRWAVTDRFLEKYGGQL